MPKIAYQEINFRPDSLARIEQANNIITDYAAQGFDLTLRQLYYQFVSRGFIPNSDREYKRLGDLINNARLAGLVDWTAITDRTRNVRANSHWEHPNQIIDSAAYSYAIDKWADQPNRVEVWIEKDALVGVIAGVCEELDVAYFSCRGYTSQSEMWAAAQRLKQYARKGQDPYILHLGDHDPSGMDMSRDIFDRLDMFMGGVSFTRLALNMDQVERYNPPPNPTKLTDARATGYMDKLREAGYDPDTCWELDALEPSVITELVRTNVVDLRDDDKWEAAVNEQERARKELQAAARNWSGVRRYMADSGYIK